MFIVKLHLSHPELFFIFSAIYENQFYYLLGFLFLVRPSPHHLSPSPPLTRITGATMTCDPVQVFIILAISCSQISIVMVYFQLCGEDYRWWWR